MTEAPPPSRPQSEMTTSIFRVQSDLESDAGEAGVVPESLAPGTAILVVRRGPSAGSRYVLSTGKVTAGRHPESEIFLDDITVSRRHSEFALVDGVWHVRDLGSLNGTYVNRDRVDDAELASGDEVRIGKFQLVFLAGGTA